ncbi:uncharacterized protein N7515_009839 [Penicillium bovifimosum]|uniref:Uncharacterized protein n=1 Tax=Penicillium bovifimosum TaxID=126998 RepID=A0A9W9GHP8_9EURO|nr:uncharacterized protein N7515_009839 [Penicillium bovifimosum]KAJ5120451.1 hypothetical protein N7515_009839 [Penicillium bovifimosum]
MSKTKVSSSRKASPPLFAQKEDGFAQFLKRHASPTHQRVTAGGRIIPMEQPWSPLPVTSSSGPYEVTDPSTSVLEQSGKASRGVTGHHRSAMQDHTMTQQPSVESPIMLQEQIPSSMWANIIQPPAPIRPHLVPMALNSPYAHPNVQSFQFPAADVHQGRLIPQPQPGGTAVANPNIEPPFLPAGPCYAGVLPRFMSSSDSHAARINLEPLGKVGVHPHGHIAAAGQLRHSHTREGIHPYYETFKARWDQMLDLIHQYDHEIGSFMSTVDLDRLSPFQNFYCAFSQCVQYSPQYKGWASTILQHKLSIHERLLSEVNQVIAFDPSVTPAHVCYELRVYHTTERGKVLAALEELQYERGGPFAEPAVQNTIRIEVPRERKEYSHSGGNVWPGGRNRSVAIVNPATGRPIQIPNQPTGHIANNGNVPIGRNGPLTDATSRLPSLAGVDGSYGWSDDDIMSWISLVGPVDDDCVSHDSQAVRRNHNQGRTGVGPAGADGRMERSKPNNLEIGTYGLDGSIAPHGSSGDECGSENIDLSSKEVEACDSTSNAPSHEEVKQWERVPRDPTSTNFVVHDPNLQRDVNGQDISRETQQAVRGNSLSRHIPLGPNNDQGIIQQKDTGRIFGLDGEGGSYQMRRVFRDDSLSVDQDLDRQQNIQADYTGSATLPGSTDEPQRVPPLELINESAPVGPNAEQQLPRTDDSDNSETPLISRHGTRRLMPRVNIRHRPALHDGVLGASSLRMIKASLETRRCQDRYLRPDTPHPRGRESLSPHVNSNVEMDLTNFFGFHSPDSQQGSGPTRGCSQFIKSNAQHTAVAVVNTSMINASGHPHQR